MEGEGATSSTGGPALGAVSGAGAEEAGEAEASLLDGGGVDVAMLVAAAGSLEGAVVDAVAGVGSLAEEGSGFAVVAVVSVAGVAGTGDEAEATGVAAEGVGEPASATEVAGGAAGSVTGSATG